MKRRYSWPQLILTTLIVILIVIGIAARFTQLLIPIVVFGMIFILYKFPPNSWKYKNRSSNHKSSRHQSPKKRNANFRVIQGSKLDDNEDNKPKYH